MSFVHPPARLALLGRRPFGANGLPGCGQVCALAGMYASMLNGLLVKCIPAVVSVAAAQSAGNGGEVRLTSFWSRQAYAAPAWLICVELVALARPLTPSQPP